MSQHRVYQPELHPLLIKALHHEARHRRMPMTKVLSEIVARALEDTEGMRRAREEIRQSVGEQVAA
jgi:hypothetical protein